MINKLDHRSIVPLHVQAEAAIRSLISSDEYRKGKLLPNEVDLAKEFNISRSTLRQAINRLVYEGLLVRRKGHGTFVAPPQVMSNARNWMSFSQEMRALGYDVGNFELHVSRKTPESSLVAAFFSCNQGQKLICLERLRGKSDTPFVYFTSYFNPSLGLTGNENFTRPLYEILEKDYGVVVQTSKEEISADGAGAFIAEKLGINEGDCILIRKRLVYDANDTPVEYNIGYYNAKYFTYYTEFRR